MPRPLVLALVLTAGCSSGFGDPAGDTGGDGTVGDDGEGTYVEGAEDLPRADQDLDTGGCEEVSGAAHPGAAAYFFGTYADSGDGWVGEEEWRLYANETWKAQGGGDCSVFWSLSASEAGAGSCGNCELGLAVSAQMDLARTTCAEDLTELEESFSTSYGIDLTDDDTRTTWYYAETGTRLGQGHALTQGGAPTAVNYATDKTCQWF